MALPARKIEISGEDVKHELIYRGPSVPGAKIFVQYAVDGLAVPEVELTPAGDGSFRHTVDIPDGGEVTGKVIIREVGKPDKDLRKIKKFTAAPEAAPAAPAAGPPPVPPPAPATPTSPDERVKGYVGSLLEGIHNEKFDIENLEAVLEQMDSELEKMPGDRQKIILAKLHTILPTVKGAAPEIKAAFEGKPPPVTVDELSDRMDEASRKFRHRVYLKLKADPDASKALGIRKGPFNYDDPFKDRRMNAIFDRVCMESDRGGRRGAARMGVALRYVKPPPPVDPVLAAERRSALELILKRRSAANPGFLKKAAPGKLDKALHLALHAGGIAALLSGSVVTGGALLAAKPVFEAVTGLKVSDMVKAYQNPSWRKGVSELWGTFKQNFFLADAIRSEKSAKEFAGGRLGYVLRGSAPGIGPFLQDDASVGGYEREGEVAETGPQKQKNVEDMIRKAAA